MIFFYYIVHFILKERIAMAKYEKRCSGTIRKGQKYYGSGNYCTSCGYAFNEAMLGKRCPNKIKHENGQEWVSGKY